MTLDNANKVCVPLSSHIQSYTATQQPTPFTRKELVSRHCLYVISLNVVFPTVLMEKYINLPLSQVNTPRHREFEHTCCSHRARKHEHWDSIQIYKSLHPSPFWLPHFPRIPRSTPACIVYVEFKFIWLTDLNLHANLLSFPTSQCMQCML